MDKYILSEKTQDDINELFKYGNNNFGKNKTIAYLVGLQTYFSSLIKSPKIGRQRNEIKKGLYSFPYKSHIIFYRIFTNHIRIVRVLHGSKDLPRHFNL